MHARTDTQPYEGLSQWWMDSYGASRPVAAVAAGVVAGPLGWIACYPIEVVRIRWMCVPDGAAARCGSYTALAKEILAEQGVRGFFRGLPGPSALHFVRAVRFRPVRACAGACAGAPLPLFTTHARVVCDVPPVLPLLASMLPAVVGADRRHDVGV